MDGVRDVGGIDGFGRVDHTPSEPVFHEQWERGALRASFGVLIALSASGGAFRHAIERMDPAHHLSSSYYEHWLTGTATLLVESGIATVRELEERAGGSFPLSRPDRGSPPAVEAKAQPGYAVGDRVRVRAWHPPGHTRAPRYVQGKRGVIVRIDGAFNLPDAEAHGGGRVPDHTYGVRFTAQELWGEGGHPGDVVHVDLWEHYLEPDA